MALLGQQEYINSLAEQVSYGNASFPSVFSHLQAILNVCRKKWICDFLFNTDPTHLTVLTAPSFLRNAIACDIKISRFQPPNMPNPYAYHFDGSIVFVPAFSIDHVSVGFGIEEKSWSQSRSFHSGESETAVSMPRYVEQFRYVRDDRNGTLIILYEHEDYFQFEFVKHMSTKRRQRSTSRFDRRMLMALVERDKDLDEERVMPTMRCLVLSDEYRRCPTCGAPPDLNCTCTLDLTPPAHPHDFSNHARQMSTHAGYFDGLMHVMALSNGRPGQQSVFGNRINMQGGTSRELITRLAHYVVRQHLQSVQPDPLSSVFPAADEPEEWEPSSAPLVVQSFPTVPMSLEAGGTAVSQGVLGHAISAPEIHTARTVGIEGESIHVSTPIYVGTTVSGQFTSRHAEPASSVVDAHHSPPFELSDSILGEPYEVSEQASPEDPEIESEQKTPMTAAEWQHLEREKEKERKRELKKHRNRLSAQRSNLKKKRENDAKKAELRELKEKEVEFRERERMLRDENMQLRKLARDKNLSSNTGMR